MTHTHTDWWGWGVGGTGATGVKKEAPSGPGESSNRRQLKRGKCERLRLIYATFHPTIKIMDDGIDSVWGGGRGHDWLLRVGEERIRLIIIRRRSQEAACWARTCG